MKRFGKWFGSSLLIVASIFMLTSILSCGKKPKTPAAKVEEFKIEYELQGAKEGDKLEAKIGTAAFKSGSNAQKGAKIDFTVTLKDADKYNVAWEGGATGTGLTASLVVAKATKVIAKVTAKGSADPALTFKSMKIVAKDVAKATDGKLSVVLPAGTTKVEQKDITEAKFMAGTKEVTDATVTLVGTPVTIDAKTQKADLKVKVAAKAGSYAETEFTIAATVEQPPIVLKEVKYDVKLANADAKDKCTVKIYFGDKAAGATTSTFTKDEAHELKPLPATAGADAGKLKTTVGTDLLFVVSFATTQNYRVKEWAGATVKPEPADKSEAQTTVGTADVNVTITLEDKPAELKATALKLVDKDRENWVAYEFSNTATTGELAKGFNPADSAIPEIKLDKDLWNGKKLKFDATCGSETGVTTEVYDGTTKVEDATGLDITETAKTIKLVVQKKEGSVVKKEGVYKFKIKLATFAKLEKIELKKTDGNAELETWAAANYKLLLASTPAGYHFVTASAETKVKVVPAGKDSATTKIKWKGAACADNFCTLEATEQTCEITVTKSGLETSTYKIHFKKFSETGVDNHIKTVKLYRATALLEDNVDEAASDGANGTKMYTFKMKKTDIASTSKKFTCDFVGTCAEKQCYLKKGAGNEEDRSSTLTTGVDLPDDNTETDFPLTIKLVVKKAANSTGTDVTTYIFKVELEQ